MILYRPVPQGSQLQNCEQCGCLLSFISTVDDERKVVMLSGRCENGHEKNLEKPLVKKRRTTCKPPAQS